MKTTRKVDFRDYFRAVAHIRVPTCGKSYAQRIMWFLEVVHFASLVKNSSSLTVKMRLM